MGELYAMRYLSSFFSLLSHSMTAHPVASGGNSMIQALLSLVKKESLVSIISLLILPEVTIIMLLLLHSSHIIIPHNIFFS